MNSASEQSGFRYSPSSEYVLRPYKSNTLNIISNKTENCFRLITSETLDSNTKDKIVIFCFGGSTTFGWNVADRHTWPYFLQSILNKESDRTYIVRNYGIPGYSATQETNQFIDILKLGHRPSLCIFMDGVNTGPIWDGAEFSTGIAQKFDDKTPVKDAANTIINNIAIVKLYHKLYQQDYNQSEKPNNLLPIENNSSYNRFIVNRFVQNADIRKGIADYYGIPIIQFTQPNIFTYDDTTLIGRKLDSIAINDKQIRVMRYNYTKIYDSIHSMCNDYLPLHKMTENYKYMPVYDGIHYTPDFNYFLSSKIKEIIDTIYLRSYSFDTKQSTGIIFSEETYND